MAPTIDTVAQEYAARLKVGKLDVGSNSNATMRYNIRGIPTVLLFKGSRVVEQRVGDWLHRGQLITEQPELAEGKP